MARYGRTEFVTANPARLWYRYLMPEAGILRRRPAENAFSVALVQSESEALHTPALDVSTFLLRKDNWRTQVFTERNFEILLQGQEQFDCVVLGFNSIYQSRALREALRRQDLRAPLLILHQLKSEALEFLKGDLSVEVKELRPQLVEAVLPLASRAADEVLLNYPHRIRDPNVASNELMKVKASILCCIPSPDSRAWRTVLEVESNHERFPVLIRTKRWYARRVIICNLWLECRDPLHARLLENMITFCAGGIPDLVVVRSRETRVEASRISQKLRLLGANPVEVSTDSAEKLGFGEWPLRAAQQLVVDDSWDPTALMASPEGRRWLASGSTLVTVSEKHELIFRYGAADEHWIAQRWAMWFNSVHPASWHGGLDSEGAKHTGSVFQTRAILRTLKRLHKESRVDPKRLGLPIPSAFAEEISSLLTQRFDKRADGSFEGTISTTSAAYDINWLLEGKALNTARTKRMESWLRRVFSTASLEDQFDIARSLKDAEMYSAVEGSLGARLRPTLVTRLRQAAIACGVEAPRRDVGEFPLSPVIAADLDRSLMLAAEYVDALIQFAGRYPDHPLGAWEEGMSRALVAVGKYGELLRMGRAWERELQSVGAEVICQEALALLSFFGLGGSTTHVMVRGEQQVPAVVAEQVLRESERSRAALAEARRIQAAKDQTFRKQRRNLSLARHILGGLLVAGATALYAATGAIAGSIVAFLVVALSLNRLHLDPPWTAAVVTAAVNGVSGLPSTIAGWFRRREPD